MPRRKATRQSCSRRTRISPTAAMVRMKAADAVAGAVAIASGRFFAVGKNADVLNDAVLGVRKIHLGGKAVLPGFNDAHLDAAGAGLSHLGMVDCALRS